jgi:rubredoxin
LLAIWSQQSAEQAVRRTTPLRCSTRLRRTTPLRPGKGIITVVGGRILYRPDPTDAELDQLCGDLVKRLADYRCQRCGTVYPTRLGEHGRVICDGLDWAHLITRRRKRTCWVPDAAAALCAGDHFYLDGNPHAKIAFAIKRLGESRYDALRWQSQHGPKVDRVATRLYLQQMLTLSAERLRAMEG